MTVLKHIGKPRKHDFFPYLSIFVCFPALNTHRKKGKLILAGGNEFVFDQKMIEWFNNIKHKNPNGCE